VDVLKIKEESSFVLILVGIYFSSMWVNQGRGKHSVLKKWTFQHQGMLVRKHVALVPH
jgi:hypothetical protein